MAHFKKLLQQCMRSALQPADKSGWQHSNIHCQHARDLGRALPACMCNGVLQIGYVAWQVCKRLLSILAGDIQRHCLLQAFPGGTGATGSASSGDAILD